MYKLVNGPKNCEQTVMDSEQMYQLSNTHRTANEYVRIHGTDGIHTHKITTNKIRNEFISGMNWKSDLQIEY